MRHTLARERPRSEAELVRHNNSTDFKFSCQHRRQFRKASTILPDSLPGELEAIKDIANTRASGPQNAANTSLVGAASALVGLGAG